MTKLHLSLACVLRDRTAPLYDGRVSPEGIDLNFMNLNQIDIFWRQLKYAEFDVSEMSLSAYIMELSRPNPRFVGLPVFLSRIFRRGNMYVNAAAGIESPEDLRGRNIGVPEYHMSAALWIRGFLADDYGVKPSDIKWVQGGQVAAGRKERVEIDLPPDVEITQVEDRTLDDMLLEGDLDAVISGMPLNSFLAGDDRVKRLFPDPRQADLEAYRKTGIFPIMHIVALRRDVFDEHPWVALNLYRAFCEARQIVAEKYQSWMAAGDIMIPCFQEDLLRAQRDFGKDPWPYGLEENVDTLEAATRYSFEQGLSTRKVEIDELFPINLEEGSPAAEWKIGSQR